MFFISTSLTQGLEVFPAQDCLMFLLGLAPNGLFQVWFHQHCGFPIVGRDLGGNLKAVNNGQEPALPSPAVRIHSEVGVPPQCWVVTSSQSLKTATSDSPSDWGVMHLPEILSHFCDCVAPVAKSKGEKLRPGSQQCSGACKGDSSSLMAGTGH